MYFFDKSRSQRNQIFTVKKRLFLAFFFYRFANYLTSKEYGFLNSLDVLSFLWYDHYFHQLLFHKILAIIWPCSVYQKDSFNFRFFPHFTIICFSTYYSFGVVFPESDSVIHFSTQLLFTKLNLIWLYLEQLLEHISSSIYYCARTLGYNIFCQF